MEANLNRSGYLIRPCLAADRQDVAKHIFGDVEVAKTLIHNVSTPEKALAATDAWIDTLAVDGNRNTQNAEHIGLWTIRDETAENRFVGIRGVFVAPGLPDNTVATFVAVARAYWGNGVSGDSSRLLCGQVFEKSDTEAVYTRVWPGLNPASEAVQRRAGFIPAGRHTLRATFGEQRMTEVLEFDLWRASRVRRGECSGTLRQVAIRLGQLAAEDLLATHTAVQKILTAVPGDLAHSVELQAKIVNDVQLGFMNPAWASYRMSRNKWATSERR